MKRLLLVLLMCLTLCAPAWSANDFNTDPNCVSLYNLESGSLGTDSIGTNTLNSYGAVADANLYQEGASSVYFAAGDDYLSRLDIALSGDFPIVLGYANPVKISVTFWFRIHAVPNATFGSFLVSKWNRHSAFESYSWAMNVRDASGTYYLRFMKGYDSGNSQENTDYATAVSLDTWYHVGCTYDDSTKAVVIRVWNDTAGSVSETTATHSNAISLEGVMFMLNAQHYAIDNGQNGWLDEVVVFNDILTSDEIDEIRNGTYGAPTGPIEGNAFQMYYNPN